MGQRGGDGGGRCVREGGIGGEGQGGGGGGREGWGVGGH